MLAFPILLFVFFSIAVAQAKTILPMEPHGLEELAWRTLVADICSFDMDAKTITVSLYEPECFDGTTMDALEPGDILVINEVEILVKSVWNSALQLEVNTPEDDSESGEDYKTFIRDSAGDYHQSVKEIDTQLINLGEIKLTLDDSIVFIDGRTEAGTPLDIPNTMGMDSFFQQIKTSPRDYACRNLFITFDGNEKPFVIQRFYVYWQ